ncbi:MAG: LL-diaminopimelate aminotransferase [Deltaproteobacteria bacterium]|nr:LL-diaminopimelate aminotransferase [Deltaproteobacteria bacterium]
MSFELAHRVKNLPPYLFEKLDQAKSKALARGVDVIDLGIGDPQDPTPSHIVEALYEASKKSLNHRYPTYVGLLSLRTAIADFYRKKGIVLDPQREVLALIGSKEGIAHIPFAFVNPGDVVLVPDPGYPVFSSSTLFAGGEIYKMPLLEENRYLPDLSIIPQAIAQRCKMMFLNYPNNPTAAVAPFEFYEHVIQFAKKYNIIVCHDAAYADVYFEKRPFSFLEIEGAKEVGIEFGSLSKTYNMTGWRIGWAVGNADIIFGLSKIKTNTDSGVFQAVQEAAICALNSDQKCVDDIRKVYQTKRDVAVLALKKAGFSVSSQEATFYLWFRIPKMFNSSESFASYVLEKTGVVITPGNGFGEAGEGYVRISLTAPLARIEEAMRRLSSLCL